MKVLLIKISRNYHLFLIIACLFFLNKLYIYDQVVTTHDNLKETTLNRPLINDNLVLTECYLPINKTILLNETLITNELHGECTGDWVYIEDDLFIYNSTFLTQNNIKIDKCFYSRVVFEDDFNYKILNEKIEFNNGSIVNEVLEFFMVYCTGKKEKISNLIDGLFSPSYKSIFARISSKLMTNRTKYNDYNVLFLGLDSISKDLWFKSLPKTSSYLFKMLNSTLLNSYNIVGDGTPAALIPLLTGYTENELPNTLQGTQDSHYVDEVYPFIWKNLSNHASLFAEDWPSIGTFQYRMIGMKNKPTTHYMRPFQLAMWNEGLVKKSNDLCLNSKRRGKIMLDYTLDFARKYSQQGFFGFSFIGEYSHDKNNHVKWIDNDLYEFLIKFKQAKLDKNTFLILFSDHGPRFNDLRSTIKGLLEERNPFFSIYVPNNFQLNEKKKYQMLIENSNRLITPFDIHETLRDIFGLKSNDTRAMSLFSNIPKERTCKQAKIDSHWCACMKRTLVPNDNVLVRTLANYFLDYLNNEILKNFTHLCSKLSLKEINRVHLLAADDSLAKPVKKEMSRVSLFRSILNYLISPTMKQVKVNTNYEEYQIQLTTAPNNAIYELTLIVQKNMESMKVDKNQIRFDLKSISRVNKYGNQANCVYDKYPELRKFCSCSN